MQKNTIFGCFLWLLDEAEAPSHTKTNDFIKYELSSSLEDIFNGINGYMFGQLSVDLNHASIDGTKIEANTKTAHKQTEDLISEILRLFVGCYFTAPF